MNLMSINKKRGKSAFSLKSNSYSTSLIASSLVKATNVSDV
jgi:hypothetical protein